ncbi:hypothetical protein G7Y89_g15015 [Cudoniella acicularis]|uniref:Uncharacterized protein n=1 Tax=Cudoniella acicularis TaxID=354080 RepID=A0A8H4VQ53_9HELO|nr:hypothetical protein G7Y89_g15015 [Cudoniella acicularis]
MNTTSFIHAANIKNKEAGTAAEDSDYEIRKRTTQPHSPPMEEEIEVVEPIKVASQAVTFVSDKLVAIFGVARLFSSRFRTTYIAGMWKEEFIPQLLWHVRIQSPFDKTINTYRAPSWSWASIDNEHLRKRGKGGWVYPGVKDCGFSIGEYFALPLLDSVFPEPWNTPPKPETQEQHREMFSIQGLILRKSKDYNEDERALEGVAYFQLCGEPEEKAERLQVLIGCPEGVEKEALGESVGVDGDGELLYSIKLV